MPHSGRARRARTASPQGAARKAQDHRAANRRGHGAAGAPDVERFAAGTEHDRDDLSVAGQAARRLGIDRTTQRE